MLSVSCRHRVIVQADDLGKLTRVISGHMGWVRAIAVDPGNQWFATGAGDRVVKVCLLYVLTFKHADGRSGIWHQES